MNISQGTLKVDITRNDPFGAINKDIKQMNECLDMWLARQQVVLKRQMHILILQYMTSALLLWLVGHDIYRMVS